MSRSIGATPTKRRGNEPLCFGNFPEQELGAESRFEEPAPGRVATLSGKPRNPDKRLHAHALKLGGPTLRFKATLCRPMKPAFPGKAI